MKCGVNASSGTATRSPTFATATSTPSRAPTSNTAASSPPQNAAAARERLVELHVELADKQQRELPVSHAHDGHLDHAYAMTVHKPRALRSTQSSSSAPTRATANGATPPSLATDAKHRTVRLLAPLRTDLASWSLAAGRPGREALVFPSQTGAPWSLTAYQSWRRRSFDGARAAALAPKATPYTLRHSFASLLLHEGRSVVFVARQMGHDARPTLPTYGHVEDELEDQPRVGAEEAIRQARAALDVPSQFPRVAEGGNIALTLDAQNPRASRGSGEVELRGLEPLTSWVRSRRSPN